MFVLFEYVALDYDLDVLFSSSKLEDDKNGSEVRNLGW